MYQYSDNLSSKNESASKSVRLAILCDASPERNGVGSYYADLVAALNNDNECAELICPRDDKTVLPRYLTPPLPGDNTQRIWLPRPIKLWKNIRRFDPQAIVVPTPGPFGIFGLIAANWLEVPLIVAFHTNYEALAKIYWKNYFGRLCQRYLEFCNRILFHYSKLVLANSPNMATVAKELGATNVELMGTTIPARFFNTPLAPLNSKANSILFIGRLAEEKNISEILNIAEKRADLRISIAGDGPMRSAVETASNRLSNLNYIGWVSRADLVKQLDSHDILLLPSSVESFGTVALEGMARGRTVIVSASCGIAEWPALKNGLFCIDDKESTIEAVDKVIQLPLSVRQKKAQIAHQEALNLNKWNLNNWISQIQKYSALDNVS